MKIGVVCYPTFGGSGVIATELGKALAAKGHEVHFITYSQPQRLDFLYGQVFYHEVDVFSYPLFQYPPYELALASKLVQVVEFENLELLHVHYAIPHASAAFMAQQILATKGINIPFITTLHGTDISLVGKNVSYEPVVTFSINKSDGVTSVSQSLKDETLDFFDIHNEIEVIPNFVDLNRFKRSAKSHFRAAICPQREKLIVHTSNFRKVKRIDDVLVIFQKVREQIPAKLLLAGDGPDRGKAEQLARELNIAEDVRFLGKIDAIEEVLSLADLFLMPSEKESFGLAALEAMACEVPVVCSNTGGLPELVEHGINGLMSDVGNVEEMAAHCLHILSDENLPTFQANALDRAHQFDIHKVVPHYENYYHKVLDRFKASLPV